MDEDAVTCTVYLTGYIDEDKASEVIQSLNEAVAEYPDCNIEFIINSNGGTISDGTAVYSELRALSLRGGGNHHITTVVRGMAGSMATLVFEAGDKRVGGELDMLVYHETRMSAEDEPVSAVAARMQSIKEWDETYVDVLMNRATVSREAIEAMNGRDDAEISVAKAVSFGLADAVV